MSKTVDPNLYALAEAFVADLLGELEDDSIIARLAKDPERRKRLVRQAADAMQQAVEDECAAIREELES